MPCQWIWFPKHCFAACLYLSFEESDIFGDLMFIFLVNNLQFGLIDSPGEMIDKVKIEQDRSPPHPLPSQSIYPHHPQLMATRFFSCSGQNPWNHLLLSSLVLTLHVWSVSKFCWLKGHPKSHHFSPSPLPPPQSKPPLSANWNIYIASWLSLCLWFCLAFRLYPITI